MFVALLIMPQLNFISKDLAHVPTSMDHLTPCREQVVTFSGFYQNVFNLFYIGCPQTCDARTKTEFMARFYAIFKTIAFFCKKNDLLCLTMVNSPVSLQLQKYHI